MAEPCEVINENVAADDALRPTISPSAIGTTAAGLGAVLLVLGSSLTSTTGTFSDAAYNQSQATVEETLIAEDDAFTVANVTAAASDEASITDQVRLFYTETIEESGALADEPVIGARAATATSAGEISDAYTPVSTLSVTVAESLAASDALDDEKRATLSDTASFSDATYPTRFLSATLADSGTLTDALVAAGGSAAVLSDEFSASDALHPTVSATATVAEEGFFEDMAHLPAGFVTAWSASTDTFAMSRWELPSAESVAEVDGVLYAASGAGLFRFDPDEIDDHGGERVDAKVVGGLSDFGAPELKRASYYYIGYTSSGSLRVTVGGIPDGVEQSYPYTFAGRAAGAPVPGRTKLGRGLRSRYWRITLENVEGATFMVDKQQMTVDAMSRRV